MPRLDQLLARNLGRSRREISKLLRAGAVRDVRGEVWRDGRRAIDTQALPLSVVIEGIAQQLRAHVHLVQHKPVGVVTSRADPLHSTAWELLAGAPMHAELKAVGRLDLDAAGLLLWTTETARIHALTHPKRAVPRTYHVALARPWRAVPRDANGQIQLRLSDGTVPRIVELAPLAPTALHPALSPPTQSQAFASITLLDGAYHEVKRCFAALGSHVLRLARVSHAGFALPTELEAGAWALLDQLPEPP